MSSLGTIVESLMSYMHTIAMNMHCSDLHLQEVQWTDSLWIHHSRSLLLPGRER